MALLGARGVALHPEFWVGEVDPDHCLPEPCADVGEDLRVALVRVGMHDGSGA